MQQPAGETVARVSEPQEIPLVAPREMSGADVEGGAEREELIAELFERQYAALVRLAYVVLQDRYVAEDVVTEAFCSLQRRWSGVRTETAPGAYLRTAVLRGCRSRVRELRRARVLPPVADVGASDASSAGASTIAHEEPRTLAVGVLPLPHRQREVVVCRYYLDLSEVETAALLGISLGAVRRHARRARDMLFPTVEGEPVNGAEDLLRQMLHSLGREVHVSDDDVAAARSRFAHLRAQRRRRRTSGVALAATAALVGAAVGGLVVRGLDGPEARPAAPTDAVPTGTPPVPGAPALTAEDLTGLWVIPDNNGWVWEFHADGTMGWMNPGLGADYEETYFQVAGDILDLGPCEFRVGMLQESTMTGAVAEGEGPVRDCQSPPGEAWTWIRVEPRGTLSASAFEGLALANTVEVSQEEAMVGVWWKEDTGQAMMVTHADGGMRYALDDDGDIAVSPDDLGSAVLDRQGELRLTSRAVPASPGTCEPGASATLSDLSLGTYDSRLWATPVRVLTATSAPGACAEHADLGGTWLRVP
jgi:RNA polymerase sigma factor (sigma-70 family)